VEFRLQVSTKSSFVYQDIFLPLLKKEHVSSIIKKISRAQPKRLLFEFATLYTAGHARTLEIFLTECSRYLNQKTQNFNAKNFERFLEKNQENPKDLWKIASKAKRRMRSHVKIIKKKPILYSLFNV
jgi:serine kinase of HPr protein (carbohydrate metabolism regulator)